jgi:CBS domain-containing protein
MLRKIIPDVVHGQDLLTLPRTATVRQAARAMAKHRVRSVLVTTQGKVAGIFTGSDLNDRVVVPGLDPDKTPLAKVMTAEPYTVAPSSNAIEALRMMREHRCRHLPVCDGERLVGIVSRRDFLGFEEDEVEHQDELAERMR